MDNVKGTKRENLQQLYRRLEEEKDSFINNSNRSMEDLEDADWDMLKRGRDLDEVRGMCDFGDDKLTNLIEEQQDFLGFARRRRMERLEDLEYYTKEKTKEIETRQEDILYQIEKEDKEQQDKE